MPRPDLDLAALRAEATGETFRVRLHEDGEWYTLPAELPYPAFRSLGRLAGTKPDDPAAIGAVLDALDVAMETLVGKEAWAREAPSLSSQDVLDLVQGILQRYGFAETGGTPEAALGESGASSPS